MGRVFNINYNHQIMRRLLSPSSLVKFNYLQNFKKPVVAIPSSTPPKYIYRPEYHPTSMPDFDMKFKDHDHLGDWFDLAYNDEEKFDFQYSGQWWDAIGISGRILIFGSMIWIALDMLTDGLKRKEQHRTGLFSYYDVGDIAASHIPTYIES